MDWDRLRVFYTVAEAGSLTHAGNELNLSQSAVSRQISALEKELHTKLFNRHARGLILTEEGTILLNTVRDVFAQLSSVSSKIRDHRDGLGGTLKIAATVGVGSIWLPNRLNKFIERYPDIRVEFVLADGNVDLKMREADCAIRFGSSRQDVDPDIVCRHLFNVKLQIYTSAAYLAKHPRPKKIEDLDHHALIAFGGKAVAPVDSVNWLLRLGVKSGFQREPKIELANAYGILQCVRQGLGIATLADYVARDYEDLVQLFPEISHPVSELVLQYPKDMQNTKKISALYEFLTEEAHSFKYRN